MDPVFASIGARMRERRRQLRRTQAQVAEAAGIDASFYGQLERGANVPSVRTLLAVAAALETPAGDLLPSARSKPADYGAELARLIGGLRPEKRRLVLQTVGDMVHRLRSGRRR